jgi:hypothetical protein
MNVVKTRRNFLKAAAFTGCVWPVHRLMGQTQDECEDRLNQMRIRYQKGFAFERAYLFKKLVSKYGSGVLDIVQQNTIEDARRTLQQADLKKRDLDAVFEVLWKPSGGLLTYRVEKQSQEFLKLCVTGCIFAEAMRECDAVNIGLAFYCAYDYGFCEGLNTDIKFTRTKTLMEGHGFCDHTYVLGKFHV